MKYTRKQIIDRCNDLINNDVSHFYQNRIINYKGQTSDTGEYYTEVIAEFILNHLDIFDTIETIHRKKPYQIEGHKTREIPNSNRKEEIEAIELFKKSYYENEEYDFGRVFDYQIPLKNRASDNGVGKIDLISYKENNIYILELKKEDNCETMLRCVLESFTYSKQIDKIKLESEYKFSNIILIPAVLVHKDGKQHNEYNDKRRRFLHQLMNELNVVPFFI